MLAASPRPSASSGAGASIAVPALSAGLIEPWSAARSAQTGASAHNSASAPEPVRAPRGDGRWKAYRHAANFMIEQLLVALVTGASPPPERSRHQQPRWHDGADS